MNIIISPEYLKLLEEVRQLKENIINLYEEKDEIVYHICRNIETEYMSQVGILEYKLFELQCGILRLKRKIQLYQIKINRQETPNEKEIDEQLDTEYKEYQEQLNKMSNDLQETLNRKNYGILTEEDSKELKRIYRKLIKKLHPDLNKESNEKNKNEILSRFMDAGKLLYGKVKSKEKIDEWIKIEMEVYLKD